MGLTPSAPGTRTEVRLAPEPRCVGEAREHVRGVLTAASREDLLDPALLLTSELVTNALLHAGTQIDLVAEVVGASLRVEVGDGSRHLPSRRRYGATAGTGRGLMMMESLVDDWGVTRHAEGKTVWFRLRTAVEEPGQVAVPTTSDSAARLAPASVPVELLNMPLLLHAAWQESAEALLRDYLLASLEDDGTDSIAMHAEATDAIAVLEEHVPRSPVELSSDELLEDALEPRVTAPRIGVPVPRTSVPHFDTLDRAIEAALDMSRDGLLTAPPSQPEITTFRRWLVHQVIGQADGAAPVPWVFSTEPVIPQATPAGFDASALTTADDGTTTGVLVADLSSTLLAASPVAVRLLGHRRESDLVGLPLVAIMPERFRQAHLAGISMYALVGRRPLIDRSVTLPALCGNGSEVLIEMCIREHPLGDGSVVLVAAISAADQPG